MIRREVVKEGVKDKEVYIRVDEDREYKVIIKDKLTGFVIKEDVKTPVVKVVKGKRYRYIRILLPWASTLSRLVGRRERYNLIVEVY